MVLKIRKNAFGLDSMKMFLLIPFKFIEQEGGGGRGRGRGVVVTRQQQKRYHQS